DEPFRINDYEDWPAGGILAMQGAVGEQGGNTMARLVVSEEGYYEVEADTDGDGAFDDYSSGPLYWGDM
ncbi:MAG: hypothetical protein R3297_09135, partial [Desulfobulbales bacterium]|nr:hypothetical protein [Desulfobulbales bacterium]